MFMVNLVVEETEETKTQMNLFNSLTTKKQTTKFTSANFQKNIKSNIYHIENSKTRGQTV